MIPRSVSGCVSAFGVTVSAFAVTVNAFAVTANGQQALCAFVFSSFARIYQRSRGPLAVAVTAFGVTATAFAVTVNAFAVTVIALAVTVNGPQTPQTLRLARV